MKNDRSYEISVGGGFSRSIFDHIVSVENLFDAWREFKKNKGRKPDVMTFALNPENNIFQLRDELLADDWACGGYQKFSIKDPKPRIIHKATVWDRVLYQAIYRVLYPIFDKSFIFDSYSSRKEKGTHAGIKRLDTFLQKLSANGTKPVYALKCDIRKFFDSIDHDILLNLIRQKVECPETMKLITRIIDSFHKTSGKGLPLGNVTSQVFANVYMNSFDHYVKHDLRCRYYLRYCDDFVILSRDKARLIDNLRHIKCYLGERLKLELHPDKIIIRKFHQGIDFLGAVLLPHYTVPRTKTKKRIIKKSTRLFQEVEKSKTSKSRLDQSLASYLGHLSRTKSRQTQSFLHSIRVKMRDLPDNA